MANIPWGFGFDRMEPNPLDPSAVFDTLAEFEAYLTGGAAYAGQVVAVRDGTNIPKVYVVNNDGTSHTEVGLGGGGGGEVISHTRNELAAMMDADELVPGALYEVSDYVTKYRMPFLGTIKTVEPEPLILRAETEDSFSPIAHSPDYPNDVIYYDIMDNQCEDGSTSRPGFIQRRIDTKLEVDCPHDWRHMVWPRFKVNSGSIQPFVPDTHVSKSQTYLHNGRVYVAIDTGIPTSVTDRNFLIELCGEDDYIFPSRGLPGINVSVDMTDYAERFTFNADIDLSKKEATAPPTAWSPSLVRIAAGAATSKWEEPHKHAFLNSVFMYDGFGTRPRLITADHGFRNNSFYQLHPDPGGLAYHGVLRFGVSCNNNLFFGPCYYNDFGTNFTSNMFFCPTFQNTIGAFATTNIMAGSAFSFNTFGSNFNSNIFVGYGYTGHNTGGSSFVYNTFKGDCDHNNFGSAFQQNRIAQGGMRKCTFGASCVDNRFDGPVDSITMGGKCMSNHWKSSCLNEIIGNSFISNEFGSQMRGNTFGNDINTIKIGNRFEHTDDICQHNTLGSNITEFVAGHGFKNNTIGSHAMHMEFGDNCFGNSIGEHCVIIRFDDSAYGNRIGNNSNHIRFFATPVANTIGEACSSVTLGNGAFGNSIGNRSSNVYFGVAPTANVIEGVCAVITAGDYTYGNTWRTRCTSITLGNACQYNEFGSGCDSVTFGDRCNDNVVKSHVWSLQMGFKCRNNHIYANEAVLGNQCNDNLINRAYRAINLGYTIPGSGLATNSNVMIGFGSNPNLLINWDLRNVVNQRGQVHYYGAVYGPDMWELAGGSMATDGGVVTVQDGYVHLTAGNAMSSGAYVNWAHNIERPEALIGKTFTLSALFSIDQNNADIFIASQTFVLYNLSTYITPVFLGETGYHLALNYNAGRFGVGVQCRELSGSMVRLYAVKLEEGQYSTLYDDRGSYNRMLQDCQRYQRVYGVNDMDVQNRTSPPMRTVPTISTISGGANSGKFLYDANLYVP